MEIQVQELQMRWYTGIGRTNYDYWEGSPYESERFLESIVVPNLIGVQ